LNPGELPQFTDHWYVTVNDCDVVLRVLPDMSLGETETGEISLDVDDALLSLNIDGDGLLEVSALNGELDSADEEFCGKQHLALDSAALIKLPNNTLRVDKDILGGGEIDASLLSCAVWRTAGRIDTTQSLPDLDLNDALESSLSSVPEPGAPEHSMAELTESELIVPVLVDPVVPLPERDDPQSVPVIRELPTQQKPTQQKPTQQTPTQQKLPGKPPDRPQRRNNVAVALSAGLVGVFIWLVYPELRSYITPEQPALGGIVNRPTTDRAAVEQTPRVVLPDRAPIVDKGKAAAAPIAAPALVEAKPVPPNLPTLEVAVTDQAAQAVEEVAVEEVAVEEVAAIAVQEELVVAAVEQVQVQVTEPELPAADAPAPEVTAVAAAAVAGAEVAAAEVEVAAEVPEVAEVAEVAEVPEVAEGCTNGTCWLPNWR